jgi:adenylate kinase
VDASGAIDEQRLVDYLQNEMRGGGFVCDYVDAQMLPDLLFDLVVLLRTDKSFLYPRLKRRGMQHRQIDAISGDKFQQSYAHAVREAFEPRLLMPLVSNELDDIERNAFTIAQDLDW